MTDEPQVEGDAPADDVLLPDPIEGDGQDTQPGDEAPAELVEPKKARQTAQDRFDELTREKHDARRDAEYWRDLALKNAPKPEPEPAKGDGRPDPAAYAEGQYDTGYIEDLTAWKADQTVTARLAQVDSQRAAQQAVQSFDAKTATLFPEGEPEGLVAFRRIQKVSTAIQDVILMSDVGPKLADHLGANPRELERLSALPPHLQAYELAKVEASFAAPAAPKPKTATDAPEPTPQVRGAGGKFTVAPDTNDFAAFEARYGKPNSAA
jgi:hypothetical protein